MALNSEIGYFTLNVLSSNFMGILKAIEICLRPMFNEMVLVHCYKIKNRFYCSFVWLTGK